MGQPLLRIILNSLASGMPKTFFHFLQKKLLTTLFSSRIFFPVLHLLAIVFKLRASRAGGGGLFCGAERFPLLMTTIIELFEKVSSHLLAQGRRSFSEGRGCLYRNDTDGTKCAVGCLISDEYYSPNIEESCLSNEAVQTIVEKSLGIWALSFTAGRLLRNLQKMHDGTPVELWKAELERLRPDVWSADMSIEKPVEAVREVFIK